MTPSRAGWSINPSNAIFNNLSADQSSSFIGTLVGTGTRLLFSQSSYSVSESDSFATITVFREGETGIAETVDYTTNNVTAFSGLDYTATTGR